VVWKDNPNPQEILKDGCSRIWCLQKPQESFGFVHANDKVLPEMRSYYSIAEMYERGDELPQSYLVLHPLVSGVVI